MSFKLSVLISNLKKNNRHEKLAELYIGEPKRISQKIFLAYISVGTLWIVVSDLITGYYLGEEETITFINLIKGEIFVLVTGILVYFLIYGELRRTKIIEDELVKNYNDITQSNLELEKAYSKLFSSENILRQQYEQIMESQQKLIESEERYRLISEATNDAIWEEKNGVRVYTEKWYEVTGYDKEEFERIEDWQKLIHPEDKPKVFEKMHDHVKNKTPNYKFKYRLQTKNGEYKWVQASGKALFDGNGQIYFKAGSLKDITEIKEYEEKLTHLAYHDQLTGLKNSRSMKECFRTLANGNRKNISLLYIDIDNFKYINDTLGHSFGDLLLISISERLDKYQMDNCNLYRLGGDEYIILFDSYDAIGDVEKLAVKVLKEFNSSFEIEKINLFVKISMGISIYPDHGNCIDEMLKNADIAVHKAKELGRNRIIIYNQPMNEAITERVIIEKQLRTALFNSEFELFYQPQLDIKENIITGFEALIRWRNPELGLVSPNRFIGIAEATHLIIPIGEWVLKNACI
ncbi:MAG: putative secreted protein, partial [Clostridiales bacterium]|nr:putative secreted protein [Clostridiales bacterium]